MSAPFDPKSHMIRIRGREDYLPVSKRLVWFRKEHPDWSIVTDAVEINIERQYAIFRATITSDDGRIMATATKMEDARGFADFLEKAETGSIGRALLLCGYGTESAVELDEGDRFADGPIAEEAGQATNPNVKPLSIVTVVNAFADEAARLDFDVYDAQSKKPKKHALLGLAQKVAGFLGDNPPARFDQVTIETWADYTAHLEDFARAQATPLPGNTDAKDDGDETPDDSRYRREDALFAAPTTDEPKPKSAMEGGL